MVGKKKGSVTWRPGGSDPEEGTWTGPRRQPCATGWGGRLARVTNVAILNVSVGISSRYLGLMRLATVMMSLRLAGALTFAPEPIVMATSFSVKVWQICVREIQRVSVSQAIKQINDDTLKLMNKNLTLCKPL